MQELARNPYCYDRWFQAALILLGAMLVLMITDQFYFWNNLEDYHFGVIVPVFAGFVIFDRRHAIYDYFLKTPATAPDNGSVRIPITTGPDFAMEQSPHAVWLEKGRKIFDILAYLGAGGGAVTFMVGSLIRSTQGPTNLATLMMILGFGSTLLSLAYILLHTRPDGSQIPVLTRLRFALLFLFPAGIWLISTPVVVTLTNLELQMMGWVAAMVSGSFNAVGEPIQRLGNLLILPNGQQVGVEDACSGIRSLTACLFAGSFLSAVFLTGFPRKVLLIGISAICAFALNFVRSLFLTVWASLHGAQAIEHDFFGNPREIENAAGKLVPNPDFILGTVHDIAGWGILIVTFVMLMSLLPLLNFKLTPQDEDDDSSALDNGNLPRPAEA